MSATNKPRKDFTRCVLVFVFSIGLDISAQEKNKTVTKFLHRLFPLCHTQIQMYNGIIHPVPLQIHHLQPLEQFLLCTEERGEGGGEQRLAKTTRTTQEYVLRQILCLPHQVGLINIDTTIISQSLECLNPYGITSCYGFHIAKSFSDRKSSGIYSICKTFGKKMRRGHLTGTLLSLII